MSHGDTCLPSPELAQPRPTRPPCLRRQQVTIYLLHVLAHVVRLGLFTFQPVSGTPLGVSHPGCERCRPRRASVDPQGMCLVFAGSPRWIVRFLTEALGFFIARPYEFSVGLWFVDLSPNLWPLFLSERCV